LVEVKREKPQAEDKQRDENLPPEFNALHQFLKQMLVGLGKCTKSFTK